MQLIGWNVSSGDFCVFVSFRDNLYIAFVTQFWTFGFMMGGSCLCVSHSVLDDVHERLRELLNTFYQKLWRTKKRPMVLECNMGHVWTMSDKHDAVLNVLMVLWGLFIIRTVFRFPFFFSIVYIYFEIQWG